jgi:hypothetical protein
LSAAVGPWAVTVLSYTVVDSGDLIGSVALGSDGSGDHVTALIIDVTPTADADGDGSPDSVDNCPAVGNPSQADCDGNGVGDACQAGFVDFNGNGVPDYCECIGDLFIDGRINGADLGALLSQWGPASATTASDLNRDGEVNGADLGCLLSNWGSCSN